MINIEINISSVVPSTNFELGLYLGIEFHLNVEIVSIQKKLGLKRFQDTMILSKVTWNLYASWNNKSILKTKLKMAFTTPSPYKNGIFKPPIQQRGIFETRVPLYKNGIFETPYTTKWSFRDTLYNKMEF